MATTPALFSKNWPPSVRFVNGLLLVRQQLQQAHYRTAGLCGCRRCKSNWLKTARLRLKAINTDLEGADKQINELIQEWWSAETSLRLDHLCSWRLSSYCN